MKRLRNVHPGEVLLEEFLKPNNVSSTTSAPQSGHGMTTGTARAKPDESGDDMALIPDPWKKSSRQIRARRNVSGID